MGCHNVAETNGSGRIDDHEERLRKLEAARREMEDALVVMAHLESKAAARIKEHAEFISDHQAAMLEFDDKLNALIQIVGRMQHGMESHS
jgi:hypothetical protein